MNISDIRTRVDALNDRSCLVTRSAEPETRRADREETPVLTLREETPVLTLIETADRSDPESGEMLDPLIQALVDKLPKPNSIWSIDDRAHWLKAAAMAFNLVYRSPERKDEQSALKSVG
jgi:hypothetical protein